MKKYITIDRRKSVLLVDSNNKINFYFTSDDVSDDPVNIIKLDVSDVFDELESGGVIDDMCSSDTVINVQCNNYAECESMMLTFFKMFVNRFEFHPLMELLVHKSDEISHEWRDDFDITIKQQNK